jgi:hypothetical protein
LSADISGMPPSLCGRGSSIGGSDCAGAGVATAASAALATRPLPASRRVIIVGLLSSLAPLLLEFCCGDARRP